MKEDRGDVTGEDPESGVEQESAWLACFNLRSILQTNKLPELTTHMRSVLHFLPHQLKRDDHEKGR